MKTCYNCKEQIHDDARICPHCRSKFRKCANCGKYVAPWTLNCPHCSKNPPVSPKVGLAITLSILALFGLGIWAIQEKYEVREPDWNGALRGKDGIVRPEMSPRSKPSGAAPSQIPQRDTRAQSSADPRLVPPASSRVVHSPAPQSKGIDSIWVEGNTIRVGDLADDVFDILNASGIRQITQTVDWDPSNPSSLLSRKQFQIGGVTYWLTFRRTVDPGLYRLTEIRRPGGLGER